MVLDVVDGIAEIREIKLSQNNRIINKLFDNVFLRCYSIQKIVRKEKCFSIHSRVN